jgi:hypothetical protein
VRSRKIIGKPVTRHESRGRGVAAVDIGDFRPSAERDLDHDNPGNGQAFPDGSKIAKLQWKPKKSTEAPFAAKTI